MLYKRSIIFLLRISMGSFMLYAGISKIINPEWSAAGYLSQAQTFSDFYNFFLQPSLLPVVNMVNEWALVLLGVSLILGIFVRWSALLGAVLMILYYFPILNFPYAGEAFIIDEHIIYALVLLYFSAMGAGRVFGMDARMMRR